MPADLRDARAVADALERGARANLQSRGRVGSIDRIESPGTLIATGDLHDNPVHLAVLQGLAGCRDDAGEPGEPGNARPDPAWTPPIHLVLQEIIHSDRLVNGMDFSYRALCRVAELKAQSPELVHTLLANHELAQIMGAGIVKDGVRVVDAFNEGLDYAFGNDAGLVRSAIEGFVRSMPLALRCVGPRGDVLVSHSLPDPWAMQRFDPGILDRALTPDDYEPRRGSAHLMVWGRGYDAEQIEDLVERWGVRLFILGHEKAPEGARVIPPCALVLNSDHEKGVYLPLDLEGGWNAQDAAQRVVRLSMA